MKDQTRKHSIGLAGEFFVAAELLRREVAATVTYGNAKKADVVALAKSGTSAVVIEVKTTSQPEWVVGGHVPEPSEKLWVFVHLPSDGQASPRYFILTAREIHGIINPSYQEYLHKFQTKHGRDFSGAEVHKLKQRDAKVHEGRWEKILDRVAST